MKILDYEKGKSTAIQKKHLSWNSGGRKRGHKNYGVK
jgi:hypothetical protein